MVEKHLDNLRKHSAKEEKARTGVGANFREAQVETDARAINKLARKGGLGEHLQAVMEEERKTTSVDAGDYLSGAVAEHARLNGLDGHVQAVLDRIINGKMGASQMNYADALINHAKAGGEFGENEMGVILRTIQKHGNPFVRNKLAEAVAAHAERNGVGAVDSILQTATSLPQTGGKPLEQLANSLMHHDRLNGLNEAEVDAIRSAVENDEKLGGNYHWKKLLESLDIKYGNEGKAVVNAHILPAVGVSPSAKGDDGLPARFVSKKGKEKQNA